MLSNKTKELRSNRRAFRNTYSKTTESIVKGIAKGLTSHEIADNLQVPLTTVVTTKGNFTRQMYYPFAYPGDETPVEGVCQY